MNDASMGKASPTENLGPQIRFYLCGDVDDFEGQNGNGKAILNLAIPILKLLLFCYIYTQFSTHTAYIICIYKI